MLTFVVPTRNRSHYLSRMLHYYAQNHLRYPILIADASDPEHRTRAEELVKHFQGRLNVGHRPYPAGTSNVVCLAHILKDVRTPYTVFGSDDDFYVPAALEQCVQFLETHPGHRVVHGIFVVFGLAAAGAHGRIKWVFHYNYRDIDLSSGSARLMEFMGNCPAYGNSVHRTEDLLLGYDWVNQFDLQDPFTEILTTCLPVIRGKVKRIEKLYKVCQAHTQQASLRGPADAVEWICNPRWAEQYARLRECLGEALARQDGISVEEGREIAKKGFWLYMARHLNREWQIAYSPKNLNGARVRFQESLRRVLGKLKTSSRIFSFIPSRATEISLPDLLNPSSPYHSDFNPVYQSITNPPSEL